MVVSAPPPAATAVLFPGCSAALVPLCQPNRCHFIRGWPGYQMALASRTGSMSNPLRILRKLDQNLTLPAEITLFGRSALALGYLQSPGHFHNTQDVDGILPLAWLQPPDAHQDFWQAVERTNVELEPDGLYLTHLFRETDVILQPDWFNHRLRLDVGLQKLAVFRPATIDLILTKMARADDDDLQDIQFLLRQETLTRDQLETAFGRARVPDVEEIRELFNRARPKVLALADW